MPKPMRKKTPPPGREERAVKGDRFRSVSVSPSGTVTPEAGHLTPEMLRAAAAAYMDRQRCNLWGQAFAILDEDRDLAVDFAFEVAEGVLGELDGADRESVDGVALVGMAQRDDLNELIDELAEDDPAIHRRIADALARRGTGPRPGGLSKAAEQVIEAHREGLAGRN